MSNIKLSLVVPCYDEEPHLAKNLKRLKKVLDTMVYQYEIIIIDDASRDKTVEIANDFIKNNNSTNNIKLIRQTENQGRGKTVSEGIVASSGNVVGFIDVDFSTSPWYPALVAKVRDGADIIIGQRVYKLKLKVLHRWILSKGYKFLVGLFLRMDLGDTESGCKFFNRDKIIPVLSQVQDTRWFWDTEIIARSHLAGLEIKELPTVFIRESLYTTVKVFKDSWRHFVNLIKFRKEIKKIKN